MHTFDTWVDHLLLYKSNITPIWESRVLELYDSTPKIVENNFGDARKFKWILKDMKLSLYNISIASLVKARSVQSLVPQFTPEDIKLIQSKYDGIIKLVSSLKTDERVKKN
jgi:hypothetical protein